MKNNLLLVDNVISERDLTEAFKGHINIRINKSELRLYNTVGVYDSAFYLPFWYHELKKAGFAFKYHIVVYFDPLNEFKQNNLLISHVGILLATKDSFKLNKVRIPHEYCKFCRNTLKDWGGKTHLMHPQGYLISDVWKDFPLTYKDILNNRCPQKIINRLEAMFGNVDIIKGDRDILKYDSENESSLDELNEFPEKFKNTVIQGDAIQELKKIPANSVDTVFIDPPYNLGKKYLSYEDERKDYAEWSLRWLEECFRVLKPDGSLFLLNIPRWAHEILIELLPKYYLIRWIVWDETAEPRGKLIPAHYALLWLSKSKKVKTYELGDDQDSKDYCLRINCVRIRRSWGIKDKISVRDVRWDIHRLKHRHKRFKFHPVQLPERLLHFIIKLTTQEGDIVLDPMVGTGTTLAVAKKMRRVFFGIDIDPMYIEITKKRLSEDLKEILEEKNQNNSKGRKTDITKKWIQIEMEELARKLGRLPTVDEASSYLGIRKSKLIEIFPNWNKALKRAKIALQTGLDNHGNHELL